MIAAGASTNAHKMPQVGTLMTPISLSFDFKAYPVRQVSQTGVVHPTWTPPTRTAQLSSLETEVFDVLVVGGGATGSGVALDCATRGLKVALVERDDFAAGTSSKSTKLIHGGIRYLAQAFQSKVPPDSLLDVLRNLRFNREYVSLSLLFHLAG